MNNLRIARKNHETGRNKFYTLTLGEDEILGAIRSNTLTYINQWLISMFRDYLDGYVSMSEIRTVNRIRKIAEQTSDPYKLLDCQFRALFYRDARHYR